MKSSVNTCMVGRMICSSFRSKLLQIHRNRLCGSIEWSDVSRQLCCWQCPLFAFHSNTKINLSTPHHTTRPLFNSMKIHMKNMRLVSDMHVLCILVSYKERHCSRCDAGNANTIGVDFVGDFKYHKTNVLPYLCIPYAIHQTHL